MDFIDRAETHLEEMADTNSSSFISIDTLFLFVMFYVRLEYTSLQSIVGWLASWLVFGVDR